MINPNKECYGCGACALKCPRKCIEMIPNDEGFLYPNIDLENYVSCSSCEDVCPVTAFFNEKVDKNILGNPIAIGGYHREDKIRETSSSGGAFSLFAIDVLKSNGVVFGCTLNDNLDAVHICIEKEEELYLLRGSKYLQSDLGDTYVRVKEYLDIDRKVLFVGTPCQAAGLKSFLGEHPKRKLLTVIDFICHGVPSQIIFDSYISDLENIMQTRVTRFQFRTKDHGGDSQDCNLVHISNLMICLQKGYILHLMIDI